MLRLSGHKFSLASSHALHCFHHRRRPFVRRLSVAAAQKYKTAAAPETRACGRHHAGNFECLASSQSCARMSSRPPRRRLCQTQRAMKATFQRPPVRALAFILFKAIGPGSKLSDGVPLAKVIWGASNIRCTYGTCICHCNAHALAGFGEVRGAGQMIEAKHHSVLRGHEQVMLHA